MGGNARERRSFYRLVDLFTIVDRDIFGMGTICSWDAAEPAETNIASASIAIQDNLDHVIFRNHFAAYRICIRLLLLWLYLQKFFATELTSRILLTAIPWFTAGITGYLLTAWICLEPTWKRRILNILISAAILRIFFLSSVPESYNCFFTYTHSIYNTDSILQLIIGITIQSRKTGLILRY